MTERSRSARYQRLTDLIDDEDAVGEMLSDVPARDLEEPATKAFVAAQIAVLRADLVEQRGHAAHVHPVGARRDGEPDGARARDGLHPIALVSGGPRLAVAVAVSAAGGQASRGAAVGYVAAHDRQR